MKKLNNLFCFWLLFFLFYNMPSRANDTITYNSIYEQLDSLYLPYLRSNFEVRKNVVKTLFLDSTIIRVCFNKPTKCISINPQNGKPNEYGILIQDIYSLSNLVNDIDFEISSRVIYKFDIIQLFKNIDSLKINYRQQSQKYTDVNKRYNIGFLDVYLLNNIEGRIFLFNKHQKKLENRIRNYIILDLNTLLEFNSTINFKCKKKETKYLVKNWQQKLKLLQ